MAKAGGVDIASSPPSFVVVPASTASSDVANKTAQRRASEQAGPVTPPPAAHTGLFASPSRNGRLSLDASIPMQPGLAQLQAQQPTSQSTPQSSQPALAPKPASVPGSQHGGADPLRRPLRNMEEEDNEPVPVAGAISIVRGSTSAMAAPSLQRQESQTSTGGGEPRKRTPADFVFMRTLGEGSYSTVGLVVFARWGRAFF